MAPRKGPFPFHRLLVVPVVTTDHETAVIVAVIPSAMQAAVMVIESHARSAVVAVAVIAAVAAHIDAEPAGACSRRHADSQRCQGSQRVRELPHCSSPLLVTWRERMPPRFCCGEQRETFLNGCSPSWRSPVLTKKPAADAAGFLQSRRCASEAIAEHDAPDIFPEPDVVLEDYGVG